MRNHSRYRLLICAVLLRRSKKRLTGCVSPSAPVLAAFQILILKSPLRVRRFNEAHRVVACSAAWILNGCAETARGGVATDRVTTNGGQRRLAACLLEVLVLAQLL